MLLFAYSLFPSPDELIAAELPLSSCAKSYAVWLLEAVRGYTPFWRFLADCPPIWTLLLVTLSVSPIFGGAQFHLSLPPTFLL